MANEENLRPRPFNTMTVEEQKKIARKGGKARTPKKRYAARLRELKKKGLTDKTVKKIVDIMEEPECSILDIKLYLDSIKGSDDITTKERIALSKAYIKLHQSHFGTIVKMDAKIDQRTITYNINNPNDKYPRIEEEH